MKAHIIFFLFITFFFGTSCNSTKPASEEGIFTPVSNDIANLEKDYLRSLKNWEKLKVKHGNSYQYQTSSYSWVGYSYITTITVKNGIVISRKFETINHNAVDEEGEVSPEDNFEESADDLGSNNGGSPALTIDELYTSCKENYLTEDPDFNEIRFTTQENGIIQKCGYRPMNCADDCYRGISISGFEWIR